MDLLLLIPPLAFIIMLLLSLCISSVASVFEAKSSAAAGKKRAYACGQNIANNRIQPDYAEFFLIAFFFTIVHVAALIIATAPAGEWQAGTLYIAVALLALRVLFRSEKDVSN